MTIIDLLHYAKFKFSRTILTCLYKREELYVTDGRTMPNHRKDSFLKTKEDKRKKHKEMKKGNRSLKFDESPSFKIYLTISTDNVFFGSFPSLKDRTTF